MDLIINGRKKEYQGKMTVQQLLQRLEISPDQVVIELNRSILVLEKHGSTELNNGDTIELVQFVGGG